MRRQGDGGTSPLHSHTPSTFGVQFADGEGGLNTLHTPYGVCLWECAFTMTERADQIHHEIAPADSTALVQDLFGKASHHTSLSASLQPRFGSLRLLAFPEAKITVEREEICVCNGHTVHKLNQRRLTAN